MYSHWSKEPLIIDPAHKYKGDRMFKPAGLWFDVDGDWLRWCEAEDFRKECLSVRNVLTLDLSNILVLPDAGAIDRFTVRYGTMTEPPWPRWEICWERLRNDYGGIIIAPYCWERRMSEHSRWYYGWDCASGCIWDLPAVVSVESVSVEAATR